MNAIQTSKMSNFRWVICSLLFLATTINYMDRQVLSLLNTNYISIDFHWDNDDYGTITAVFSLFYAAISLFAGKFKGIYLCYYPVEHRCLYACSMRYCYMLDRRCR